MDLAQGCVSFYDRNDMVSAVEAIATEIDLHKDIRLGGAAHCEP